MTPQMLKLYKTEVFELPANRQKSSKRNWPEQCTGQLQLAWGV